MNIKQIYSLELEKKKRYNENLELISKSKYRKISNIRRTKSQNLNVSRLV